MLLEVWETEEDEDDEVCEIDEDEDEDVCEMLLLELLDVV